MVKRFVAFVLVVFGLTAFAGAVPPLSFTVQGTGTGADGFLVESWNDYGGGSWEFAVASGGVSGGGGINSSTGFWYVDLLDDASGDSVFFNTGSDAVLGGDGVVTGGFASYASFQVPEPAMMTTLLALPIFSRRRRWSRQ